MPQLSEAMELTFPPQLARSLLRVHAAPLAFAGNPHTATSTKRAAERFYAGSWRGLAQRVCGQARATFIYRCGSSMPIQQQQHQEEKEESGALEDGEGAGDAEHHHHPATTKGQESSKAVEVELADIARDLNKIKRQNTVTHVLLGTVILMTAAWQVNEVSFLLWVQKKLSNPFTSLGELVKGSLKLRERKPVIEASPLPPVGVPDVARADLPTLVISGEHR